MKRKDFQALHTKDTKELEKELAVKRHNKIKFQLEERVKPSKNVRLIRAVRDDIARILTVINERKQKENIKP